MTNTSQNLVNAFFDTGAEPRNLALEALGDAAEARPPRIRSRPFSLFVTEDVAAASALVEEMVVAAEAESDDEAALGAALQVAARAPEGGLADQAVKLFVTHHASAAKARLPNLMSRMIVETTSGEDADTALPPLGGSSSPDEDRIAWFREDPLLNEHHEHWHLVYWLRDIPRLTFKVRPRHGELFFYMHTQMLARYETERLASGLRPVKAFSDYNESVGVGYKPGALRLGSNAPFTDRSADAYWDRWDMNGDGTQYYTKSQHEALRNRFYDAVARRALERPDGTRTRLAGHEGSDFLGDANEPNRRTYDPPESAPFSTRFYGNHHGLGHMLTAALGEAATEDSVYGVMSDPATAIRDPFFWRWHKHIDDLNFNFQQSQPAHDFSDRPAVRFGGGDDAGIVVLRSDDLLSLATELGQSAGMVAANALGGASFGANAASGELDVLGPGGEVHKIAVVDAIDTEMRQGLFQLSDKPSTQFTYPYLWHRPYHLSVRVRNEGGAAEVVTVRVYLCPADGEDDAALNNRRLWIELDKFGATLQPGEDTVLSRSDREFSTIRRPVLPDLADPAFVRDRFYGLDPDSDMNFHPDNAACECGWPYHLLYPRGTAAGMRFALLAIVTKDDQLAEQGQCGSMSFCSVARDQYPDKRPMGYPFDRPLSKPLKTLVFETPSMAMRFITISTGAEPS